MTSSLKPLLLLTASTACFSVSAAPQTNSAENKTADWMEKVTDEQYGVLKPAPAPTQPSRAQQLMGETAPKLAELTDNVLYNDI